MKRVVQHLAALGLTLTALGVASMGCEGASTVVGVSEPVSVTGAQFVPGPIPATDGGLEVTGIYSNNNLIQEGQGSDGISGDVQDGAYAIGIRFDTLGTGYWVVPVGSEDTTDPGNLNWSAVLNFADNLPVTTLNLNFAASNAEGVFGPVNQLPITVASPYPTGNVVISLVWDTAANLDLHVVSPSGDEIYWGNMTDATLVDGGIAPGAGELDRDANANCVQTGPRQEDVVFPEAPFAGNYIVRVDMFDACGAASADFVLTVRVNGVTTITKKGTLIALDANAGGAGSGLFVLETSFN